jgi:hypothetical protein
MNLDYNTANDQLVQALIPKGTPLKVRLSIKPGEYDAPEQGWTDGWATCNEETGSVYLSCRNTVLEGEFKKRKLFGLIGLRSLKGPTWEQMGASFIKGILNSARGIDPSDGSPKAMQARRITGFHELNNLIFAGRAGIDKNQKGEERSVIKTAIQPGDVQYAETMGVPARNSDIPERKSDVSESDSSLPPAWAT